MFDVSTSVVVFTALGGLVTAFALYYWKHIRKGHYWKLQNVPSDFPFPFLGMFVGLFKGKTFFGIDNDMYEKYGRVFGGYSGTKPMLFVGEPELLRKIFVKDFHVWPERREFKSDCEVVGKFVSITSGEEWKRVRSVITPAFSTGKLKKMAKLMMDCADTTADNFLKATASEGRVDCKRVFGGYTLDVIASAAFGTKLNSAEDPDNVFVKNVRQIFNPIFSWRFPLLVLAPKLATALKITPFPRELLGFFGDLTMSIVRRRKNTNEVRDDFLNALMEAQENNNGGETTNGTRENFQEVEDHKPAVEEVPEHLDPDNKSYFKDYAKNKSITAKEFVAQCILFFLAGYDTTATTLAMTVYYMAQNPERQQKLVEEVDHIWKTHEVIDADALKEMKYADAAISETLRMAPPVTRLERQANEDYPLGDTGITIPKGMVVGVPIYAMHFDPEFFPNPHQYDPDRFLAENKDLIQPYTYLPFGAGPRNCLGMRFAMMEIKICLLRIYKEVLFQVCPQTKIPMEFTRASSLFQPKDISLTVVKRNK